MILALGWTNLSLISLSVAIVILARWCRTISGRLNTLEMWMTITDQKINPNKRIFDYTDKGLRNELHNQDS
jgi:hypothetical protein